VVSGKLGINAMGPEDGRPLLVIRGQAIKVKLGNQALRVAWCVDRCPGRPPLRRRQDNIDRGTWPATNPDSCLGAANINADRDWHLISR
jgi:hypothetical protein